MKLAYFVHDLADPAVTRRVRMLQAGGAEPVVLGFRRTETAPADVAGAPAVAVLLVRRKPARRPRGARLGSLRPL